MSREAQAGIEAWGGEAVDEEVKEIINQGGGRVGFMKV